MALLILYIALALGISFLCSLLEATLLASRNGYLSEAAAGGNEGARRLLDLKLHRIDDAISAILVLNTVSNTAGATLAGSQAGKLFGSPWLGVFSALLTLGILFISEIIPKTLGAVYASQLAPTVGWILDGLIRVMRPVLAITGALTRLLTRGRQVGFSRSELAAVIATASVDGTISAEESRMFANMLRADEIRVGDIMTPRTVTFALPIDETIGSLMAESRAKTYSRIPLYDGDPENVVGYVLVDDALRAAAERNDRSLPLGGYRRDISFIPELATVGAAMKQVLQRGEHIAMVTDEHGGIAGLVTLEDLTETFLGTEIVDESDRVVDLRDAAARLRDLRLERLRQRRQLLEGGFPEDERGDDEAARDGEPSSEPS